MPRDSRLYAIGDTHGHLRETRALVKQLVAEGMEPERDTVVFLGDYVDRGPDVCGLVAYLMLCPAHWVFLRGNHDQMLLDALERPWEDRPFLRWFTAGGRETWYSYISSRNRHQLVTTYPWHHTDADRLAIASDIPDDHLAWLEARPLWHETDRHLFVHAGLRPGVAPADARPRDLLWMRREFIASDHDWGKIVVFGHTTQRAPLVLPNKIGIDTLQYPNGSLTAVRLDTATPVFFAQPLLGGCDG